MIKSIFKKMKAKANIKQEQTMLVDILKKAEKKHKQEKSLAAKLITTPKFSVESLTKNYTEQIMDISSKKFCLLYTSPSPRDLSTSRMPSSA